MPKPQRLYLIDGHALAYRTYFALTRVGEGDRWTTKAGEPTAGTYGFASVLLRLLEQDSPEYLAVSFDTGRTFRDDLYPEYKGTRSKMPEDLQHQLERIRQVVDAFGIPILEAEGYEADDVLGTVARRATAQGLKVIVITGDRDLLQLVDEHTTVRLAGQKLSEAIDYGPAQVLEKLGVPPAQIVDYKSLVGDVSDNIPGVSGIGEKSATNLLGQYSSLEDIYAHLDDIPPRIREKLMAGKKDAELSQKLAAIVTDVPLDFDLEACRVRPYDRERVVELFRDLEFRSLLPRIPGGAPPAPSEQMDLFATKQAIVKAPGGEMQIVDSASALGSLGRRLSEATEVAFDVETTGTNAMRAELVGISLALTAEEGYYIPVGHREDTAGGPQLKLEQALEAIRPALTDPRIGKVGHNCKYDYIVLSRYGIAPVPLAFDTMIAEWLCDPGSRNLGLKSLAWVRLGTEMTHIQDLIGTGRAQRTMAEVPIAAAAPYAIADACSCLALKPIIEQELEHKRQLAMFRDLEMPLVAVLAEMEIAGVLLDTAFLDDLSKELAARLAELEREIYRLAGHSFNVNSTQQLSAVLFQELRLTPPDRGRKTSSGHYSTSAAVLEELRKAHPIVERILEQREIAKLKSTYADALPLEVDPTTGRVHTSYSQTGSVTGRIASSEPNLQNIPIRSELGRRVRRAFTAAPGTLLLSVDYSQIELRIVAHISQDPAMILAFQEDQDIHAATAAAIYNVPHDAVTPEMRRHAKAVNFGLIYGMSPFGLSRSTDLTLAEAEDFVKAYFARFPGVSIYLEGIRAQVTELGYVETLLGRRRYFPQLSRGATAVPEVARARALREAINAPIQGTAADIIKLAMLRLPGVLREAGSQARMLLQVHDELVFECPARELESTARLVRKTMQEAFTLGLPLKAEAKAGRNWNDMQPVS